MKLPNRKKLIYCADAYKYSHYLLYPDSMKKMSSYIESRGGEFNLVLPFGFQKAVMDYLLEPITMEDIDIVEQVVRNIQQLPFNRAGWEYIVEKHNGYLPLTITSVDEGTVLPPKNVLVQIINNDENCAWLTQFVETALLRAIWYPTTVASLSYHCKNLIKKYMEKSCDDLSGLDYNLLDFGARGNTSHESATLAGMAHLINFKGTDTSEAIYGIIDYYGGVIPNPLKGIKGNFEASSATSLEHSITTAWGASREKECHGNMIDNFLKKDSIVSNVMDTVDVYQSIEEYICKEFKDKIKLSEGVCCVRLDSGSPIDVICGTLKVIDFDKEKYQKYNVSLDKCKTWMEDKLCDDVSNDAGFAERGDDEAVGYFIYENVTYQIKVEIEWNRYDKQYYYIDSSEIKSCEPYTRSTQEKGILEVLWDYYGGTVNSKGYKVLPNYIRCLQGDGIDRHSLEKIMQAILDKGFSLDNINFGMGGALHQHVNRDTLKFAQKASYVQIGDEEFDICKNPITDQGKKSKEGILELVMENGEFKTVKSKDVTDNQERLLKLRYENGVLFNKTTFDQIRKNVESYSV